jgi:hypothetical protein
MRRSLVVAAAVIVTVLLGSCFLFVAKSEFYVTNETGADLTVSWTERYHDTGEQSEVVEAGATVLIATGRLLEADTLPPQQFFISFQITGDAGSYVQDPIDDDAWDVVRDGRLGIWTLTITAADLE